MSEKPAKRNHKATYAADKKKGGWLIRVEGPTPEKFAGREVPVTKKNGDESKEKLERMIWLGVDDESGKPVALYTFQPKPREEEPEAQF